MTGSRLVAKPRPNIKTPTPRLLELTFVIRIQDPFSTRAPVRFPEGSLSWFFFFRESRNREITGLGRVCTYKSVSFSKFLQPRFHGLIGFMIIYPA